MNAPPSMDVWTGDLARSTAALSAEVYGAYMRLLFHQWEHGKIPRHIDDRQRVCGVTPERWDAVWARIADRFEPLDDDGNLGHPRITKERPEAIEKWKRNKQLAKERSEYGRKGGQKRANKQQNQPQVNFTSPSKTPSTCLEEAPSKSQALLEVEGEVEGGSKKKGWLYKSKEFLDVWKLFEGHCLAIGGVTQQKLDVDLLTLFGFQDEAKAIRWLKFSVSVSKAGNLCDPDRYRTDGAEGAEHTNRASLDDKKKQAADFKRANLIKEGRRRGLSDEVIDDVLAKAGLDVT